MPWKMSDAPKFTKKAKSPKAKRTFSKTANAVLSKTGDEGKAVRIADAAVKKGLGKKHQVEKASMSGKKRFKEV